MTTAAAGTKWRPWKLVATTRVQKRRRLVCQVTGEFWTMTLNWLLPLEHCSLQALKHLYLKSNSNTTNSLFAPNTFWWSQNKVLHVKNSERYSSTELGPSTYLFRPRSRRRKQCAIYAKSRGSTLSVTGDVTSHQTGTACGCVWRSESDEGNDEEVSLCLNSRGRRRAPVTPVTVRCGLFCVSTCLVFWCFEFYAVVSFSTE